MIEPSDMLTVYQTTPSRGVLRHGGQEYPCALGRGGVAAHKQEGDGATPAGTFALRQTLYRADRLNQPDTRLPVCQITRSDGWCDDPKHAAYNQRVQLPFDASHEKMWRDDGLYDIVVVIGHNDDPPRPGLGSAIFLHCAAVDFAPTEGCVAISREDLLGLLPDLSPAIKIEIKEAD